MSPRSLRCVFGFHDFRWPPHRSSDNWLTSGRVFQIECSRGCGARTVWRCDRDDHWASQHPDLNDPRYRESA